MVRLGPNSRLHKRPDTLFARDVAPAVPPPGAQRPYIFSVKLRGILRALRGHLLSRSATCDCPKG